MRAMGGTSYSVVGERDRQYYGPPDRQSWTATCDLIVYGPLGLPLTCDSVCCGTHYEASCTIAPYPSCRHSANPLVVPSECGTPPNYSPLNRSLAALRIEFPVVYEGSLYPPTCLTCEQLPMGTADGLTEAQRVQQVRDKYDCLRAGYTAAPTLPIAPVDRAQVQEQAVRNLKLLFELQGHRLLQISDAWDFIRGLYQDFPAIRYDCGPEVRFTPPEVPPSCTGLGPVNGLLDMCARLTADNVPFQLVNNTSVYNECMNLFVTRIQAISSDCQATAYRDAYAKISGTVVAKSMEDLSPDIPGYTFPIDALQVRLHRIDDWYGRVRDNIYTGADPDAKLWSDTEIALSGFWSRINTGGFVQPDGSPTTLDVFNKGLDMDWAVLTAALTNRGSDLPLLRAPLVTVLGESLKNLVDRLRDNVIAHDLGCRFLDCSNGRFNTEVSELYRLLAAIPVDTDLNQELSRVTALTSSPYPGHSRWKSTFDNLYSRHQKFRAAVSDITGTAYNPDDVSNANSPRPPLELLAKLIREAQLKARNYRNFGRFDGTDINVVRSGLAEAQATRINDQVARKVRDLRDRVRDFNDNRNAYVRNLLAELQRQREQDNIMNNAIVKAQRFDNLSQDLAGLRNYAALEEAHFSDLATAVNQVVDQLPDDYLVQLRSYAPFAVSAMNARYDGIRSNDVRADALIRFQPPYSEVFPWTIGAQKGDILNIETRGQWAPTCALKGSDITAPFDRDGLGVDVTGALTGPEGWVLVQQGSRYRAAANVTSSSSSSSSAACGGISVAGGIIGGIIGAIFGGGQEGAQIGASVAGGVCRAIDGFTGTQSSEETRDGREQRTSAAFTTGLRLENTPYKNLPAGGLLLVQMPRHGSEDPSEFDIRRALDIHILQSPMSSIVVVADADIYLVTNDRLCGDSPTNELTVTVRVLEPARALSRALGEAMANVYAQMRQDTETYSQAGRVLQQDLIARREMATQFLRQACGQCDLSRYPESLIGFWNAYVSKELARLERKVEMRAIERELNLQVLEMRAIQHDVEASRRLAYFEQVMTGWSLKNLDGDRLRREIQDLASTVIEYLHPIINIKWPEASDRLLSSDRTLLENLGKGDWAGSIVDLGNREIDAVNQILTRLNDARDVRQISTSLTAVSFPRVGLSSSFLGVHVADPARVQAMWIGLNATNRFTLSIKPEDLYSYSGGAYTLLCSAEAPIIRAMSLIALRDVPNAIHDHWDTIPWTVRTDPGPSLRFVTRVGTGPKDYALADQLEWSSGVRMLSAGYSADYAAETLFYQRAAGLEVGMGLSAFTAFQVDATAIDDHARQSGYSNPLKDADEILLLFQVEKKQGLVDVPGICP